MNQPNLRVAAWRRRTKQQAVDLLGGACSRCGYSKCLDALEFHHTDPTAKEMRISSYLAGWERLRKELSKCVLLCANCHREVHAEWKEKKVADQERALAANRQKKSIEVVCAECGTPKKVFASRYRPGKKFFCNVACKAQYSNK